MSSSQPAPIAIVGMSCRFPGAPDLDSFWRLLLDGGDAIGEIPPGRWNLDAIRDYNRGKPLPGNVTRGGWLPSVREFDNTYFRMSPREARTLDPKQRLILEVTCEALQDANIAPDQLGELIGGVFIGAAQSEYLQRFFHRMELADGIADRYTGPGNDASFTSGRISAVFGFDGPCVNVNTACSTSLVAVHQALQSLRAGECDIAVTGGVSIIHSPELTLLMNQFGVLSPDGRCKAFSDQANGYARAEGCGMIVLRPLDDALAHGDRVYAVIRGSAINHNGLSDNMMAPEAEAQARLIHAALRGASIEASTIDYIEAHGTGTIVGDPIEVSALAEVFAGPRTGNPAWVGSVKTNIGHLEVTAGIAGVIKTTLALYHHQIPRHLHLTTLNPAIDPGLPFIYPRVTTDWPRGDHPRRGVVNSFGISGINAAIILEESPGQPSPPIDPHPRASAVLPLSAYGDLPLRALAGAYAERLAGADLADVACTAATGRTQLPMRLVLQATTAAEAREALAAFSRDGLHPAIRTGEIRPEAPIIALLFTGQGAQYAGMGREIYGTEPVFRNTIDRIDALVTPMLGRSLRAVMFGDDTSVSIDDTAWTQPALFAFEYAMATLWRSWGIEPDLLIGHSIGEIAAAAFADVMSLPDALRLVVERGRLMQALPRDGAMAAIFADVNTARQAIAAHAADLSIASDNGPSSTVISGRTAAVDAVVAALTAQGVGVRALTVSHAFHSPLMDPILDAFGRVAASIPMRAPTIPIVSNASGSIAGPELSTGEYWVRHLRGTVRFREGVDALIQRKVALAIEVGPEPHLAGMARRCAPKASTTWTPSTRRDRPAGTLQDAVGEAWLNGAALSWTAYWSGHETRRIALPQYPFQRRSLFVEDPGPRGIIEVLGGLPAQVTTQAAPAPQGQPATSAAPTYDRAAAYRMRWMPVDHLDRATLAPGRFIVGLDQGRRLEPLARAMEAAGHQVVRVMAGERNTIAGAIATLVPGDPSGYRALIDQHRDGLRGWISGWSLDLPATERDGAQWTATAETTSLSHMFAAQAMLGAGAPGAALWLVTQGAEVVTPGESPNLAQVGGWGIARVLGLEHRNLPNLRVDLDPARADVDALIDLVLRPPQGEDQLASRRGGLYALRLTAHRPSGPALRPRPDGCWIVSGGLGALGLAVGEWLAARGATRIVLCGRSAPKDEARAAITRMEAAGALVLVEAVDVSDATQVSNLFSYLARKGVPVRGVVHAAGVLADAPILRQDRARFYEVFPAKVQGAWNLHKATESLDLDAFILFSSVTSTLGAPGQVNYAAANAFLDGLAWYRHHRGLPAVSINWGPWGEIGMAAKLAALMASRGMGGLATAPALDAMGALAWDLLPQVTFMDMRVRDILAREPSFKDAPLMREIMRDVLGPPATRPAAQSAAPSPQTVTHASPVTQATSSRPVPSSPQDRAASVAGRLRELAEDLLGVDRGSLNPTRPLSWQGFDSVMALDLVQAIRKEFSVELDAAAVTVGPPVSELVQLVLGKLPANAPFAAPATPPPANPAFPSATPAPAAPPPVASASLRHRLAALPVGQRAEALTAELSRMVEQMMGFGQGDLDPRRPLAWQGFDSVMATDLQARLKKETSVELPLDGLVTGPRVTDLAADLLGRIDLKNLPPAGPTVPPAGSPVIPPIATEPVPPRAMAAPAAPAASPALAPPPASDVLGWLRAEAEKLLGFSAGELDPNRPLAWQGFDSVMATDLQRAIKAGLGVDLPLDGLVTGPRLTDLANELAGRARAPTSTAAITAPAVAPTVAAPSSPAPVTSTLEWLRAEAEKLLGFSAGDLDPNRPLAWQGFDSVMATDLQRAIKTGLGVDLPLDGLVTGPRLTDLAADIDRHREPTATPPRAVATPAALTNPATPPATPPARPPVAPAGPDALSWAPPTATAEPERVLTPATASQTTSGRQALMMMIVGMVGALFLAWIIGTVFAARPPGKAAGGGELSAPAAGEPAPGKKAPGKPAGKKGGAEQGPPAPAE